jgi:anti-sigma B factor antagonist
MEIARRDEDGIAILSLQGRLNQASADALHTAAMQAVQFGCRGLVIEMKGVDFIASVGIRALIRPSQAINLNGGKLAVADLNPQIRDFFKLTGLDQMFTVYDTADEACNALRG